MKIKSWHPEEMAAEILSGCMERLVKAATVVRDFARKKVPVWTGKLHGPYGSGKYAGQIWTARDQDNLLKTIRVVQSKKKEEWGVSFRAFNNHNVWIMAGNYKTWYAIQVENHRGGWHRNKDTKAFLRPAFKESEPRVKQIVENGD